MNKPHHTALPAALALLLTLTACGGGGDDGPSAANTEPALSQPTSGAYGWTLKASGPTSALKYGLSLVHPALPDNEYVIENANDSISDTRLVTSGTVDATQRTVTAIQAYALVYIAGGDVRSVPMQANGSSPLSHLKRSNTSSACRFLLAANDHANPDNSRFIVSTAGGDGICGNADDGRAEVRLSAGPTLGYNVITGELPLEVARDPATLAPRGWIQPRSVALWAASPASAASAPIPTRAASAPAITSVTASTYRSALVADGTRLSVLDFGASNTVTETPLDATLTAGNWQQIGFDAQNYYVYQHNPDRFDAPWKVLKISRTSPTATQLSSGTGLVSVASMGSNVLYLSVFTGSDNRLVRLGKASGTRFETTFPINTSLSVQTSAYGRHQLWLVNGLGTPTVSYSVDIIDETGNTLYSGPGGYPLSVADTASMSFDTSESRSRFVFAQGFGALAFSNASLVSYDAQSGTARVLGALPGTAEYGSNFVFATASGGPGSLGVGFATRSSAGSYVAHDAKVFSYDLGTANSLKTTTRR